MQPVSDKSKILNCIHQSFGIIHQLTDEGKFFFFHFTAFCHFCSVVFHHDFGVFVGRRNMNMKVHYRKTKLGLRSSSFSITPFCLPQSNDKISQKIYFYYFYFEKMFHVSIQVRMNGQCKGSVLR